jgi:diacylglycerol kinase (ATP)
MSSAFGTLVLIVDRCAAGQDPAEITSLVSARGLAARSVEVGESVAATEATREALRNGDRFIVAVGDDTTVNDVVNGMMEDDRPIGEHPILGVLPTNEMVDFIKTFGLPSDPVRAARHLEGGGTFAIDVGRVTARPLGADASPIRYFVNVAQAGLGAAVLARSERLPGWLGRSRYFTAFWTTLPRFRPRHATVEVDGRSFDQMVRDVVVANCQFHRGGLMISPRSWPGDGLLDVLIMTGPKSEAFSDLPKMFRGEHLPHRHIVEVKGRMITLDGERPLVVEADGRVVGQTPAAFELIPQPISVKI